MPQTLFQVDGSFAKEKKFDEATAAWETPIGKFPGTEPAAHAQFEIASTFETEKGDPVEAIERFKKVIVDPWQTQAKQRIAVMEARALTVVNPRAFRSGEMPYLKGNHSQSRKTHLHRQQTRRRILLSEKARPSRRRVA